MISKNPLQQEEKPSCSQHRKRNKQLLKLKLTCSSKDNDAARIRDFAMGSSLFKEAFFSVGLLGGEISDAGVVLVSALDRSSDMSSPCAAISHIGSLR